MMETQWPHLLLAGDLVLAWLRALEVRDRASGAAGLAVIGQLVAGCAPSWFVLRGAVAVVVVVPIVVATIAIRLASGVARGLVRGALGW